jgi:serine/threonine protein kinase
MLDTPLRAHNDTPMQPDPPPEPSASTVPVGRIHANEMAAPGDETVDSLKPPTPAAPPSPIPQAPTRVEDYDILRELGRGGMGEVFLAFDPVLSRRIALKRVRRDRMTDAATRDRFTVEARITAMLQHPSIIPVYRFSSCENDLFYTMRPVEGMTLADILGELRKEASGLTRAPEGRRPAEKAPGPVGPAAGGESEEEAPSPADLAEGVKPVDVSLGAREQWTVQRLVRLFLQATGAVAFAHSKGVIHRDLKPANIMIGPFEEVLVLDWGLAKSIEQEDDGAFQAIDFVMLANVEMQTASQMIIGTPGYISREHLETGVPPSIQSDVFALGVILYELLSMRPPWSGRDVKSLVEAMRDEPPHPTQLQPGRDIPAALAEVAMRAIHPDATRRYDSVRRFAHDVAHALEGRASWQPIEAEGVEQEWRLFEGRLEHEDDALVLKSGGRNQEFGYVHAQPFFANDIRVEFEFSLRKGRHALSVLLNCEDLRNRDEPTGYRLGIISRKRRVVSLLRNGRDVAGSRSPEFEPKTWYHAVVERNGDQLLLQIDGEYIYAYSDSIPLRGGYVAINGEGTGVHIRNLRLWSRGASSMVSCLAVPDAFFNHNLYEEARSEYLRIASSLAGRREGRLAAFRAGLCYVEMARAEDDDEVRDLLLQEAQGSFLSLRGTPRSCLVDLGRAIVAGERHSPLELRAALCDALEGYPDDPHRDAVREWLLSYLHGLDEYGRKELAELVPLAMDNCVDSSGIRVVRDLLQRVRTDWEVPSFMTGRLQGKIADASFRAEVKLFFSFWSPRPEVIDEAAGVLLLGEKLRPYQVTDAAFALLELGSVDRAADILDRYDRIRSRFTDDRYVVASALIRSAILALRGDLDEAEKLILSVDCEATDRGFNTARLAVARAQYREGRYGQIYKVLKSVDRHDAFAREHRAWFALKMGDARQALKDLAPLIERGSHERGRNLTNFLYGLCLMSQERLEEAMQVFLLLPFRRHPRTWTLGSHYASGVLSGEILNTYVQEAFPWELKHLYAQMALLAMTLGDESSFAELMGKSQAACEQEFAADGEG